MKDSKKSRSNPAFSFFKPLKKDAFIKEIHKTALNLGVDAYLVGGVVRNCLLKEDIGRDYDILIEHSTKSFSEKLALSLGGSFFMLDEETSTYRVITKRDGFSYTIDVSLIKGSIAEDLKQRDFTVNAVIVSIDSIIKGSPVISDPFKGVKDAKDRVLRAVGRDIFDKDALRVLRAIRLCQQYNLKLAATTSSLINAGVPLLSRTPKERIRDELILIFSGRGSCLSLRKLSDWGVFKVIIPEVEEWRNMTDYDLFTHSLKTLDSAEGLLTAPLINAYPGLKKYLDEEISGMTMATVLKLGAFFHDAGKPLTMNYEDGVLRFIGHEVKGEDVVKKIFKRLKFSRKVITFISAIARNHHRIFNLAALTKPSMRSRAHFFNSVGASAGVMLLLIGLSDAKATRGGEDYNLLERVKDMLDFYFNVYSKRKKIKPIMNGEEIMKTFGVGEGVMVGEIIKKLEQGIEEGVIRSKKSASVYIENWLKERES